MTQRVMQRQGCEGDSDPGGADKVAKLIDDIYVQEKLTRQMNSAKS